MKDVTITISIAADARLTLEEVRKFVNATLEVALEAENEMGDGKFALNGEPVQTVAWEG